MRKIVWGFFKKAVVADTLATIVDAVYKDIDGHAGFAVVLAVLFFTLQIYCDFSGYSDIAIGSANLFGIDLMENFRCPYFSTSIHDFWKKWHISLSTWFRDYVYIPLGGNRCSKLKQKINLMITFFVSGLWHGANWTFVVWGGLHGIAQVVENIFVDKIAFFKKRKIGLAISWLIVFVFCNLSWVFFRAESFGEAISIYENLFVGIGEPVQYLKNAIICLSLDWSQVVEIFVMLFVLVVGDICVSTGALNKVFFKIKPIGRYVLYALFIWYVLSQVPLNGGGEFIYFQF